MPRRASDLSCPQCGGRLEIVTDGMVGRTYPSHGSYHVRGAELQHRMVSAPFAACSSCEYCIEIRMERTKWNET